MLIFQDTIHKYKSLTIYTHVFYQSIRMTKGKVEIIFQLWLSLYPPIFLPNIFGNIYEKLSWVNLKLIKYNLKTYGFFFFSLSLLEIIWEYFLLTLLIKWRMTNMIFLWCILNYFKYTFEFDVVTQIYFSRVLICKYSNIKRNLRQLNACNGYDMKFVVKKSFLFVSFFCLKLKILILIKTICYRKQFSPSGYFGTSYPIDLTLSLVRLVARA